MTPKVYCFEFRNRRGLLFLKTDEVYDDKKLFKGMIFPECLNTHIVKGTTYHPYAHLSDPYNLAISTKFRNVLQANNITGWKTYPINIKDCDYEYWGFQILGKTGSIKRPSQAGWVKGMNINMNDWDGVDIFSSSSSFEILFTEKVKIALLASDLFFEAEMVNVHDLKWYSV